MLFFWRVDVALSSCRNPRKELETRMHQVPTDTKRRMPSSRVLEEVIHQAPAEYVTVGWLTSTMHRHSFGIIMLSLGLLATTPVASTSTGKRHVPSPA
jgi:hypothetical protein